MYQLNQQCQRNESETTRRYTGENNNSDKR